MKIFSSLIKKWSAIVSVVEGFRSSVSPEQVRAGAAPSTAFSLAPPIDYNPQPDGLGSARSGGTDSLAPSPKLERARAVFQAYPLNQKGVSSIAAALTLLILAALGGVLTYLVAAGSIGSMNHVSQVQALYVTQAGIEWAVKRVYDQQSEIVDPPGLNFADGTFTVSRSGKTLTITGTVGNAVRAHSVDSPTEADCTVIDTSNVNLGANDTRIQQLKFNKICLTTVTINQMQLSWVSDNGERLTEIRIESTTVYTNPAGAPSGTLLEIADYVLTNPNTNVINRIQFDSDISNKTVTLSFIMGDGSVKTVTFETED